MKLCATSRSHQRLLSAGELTQLEWIDLCANELGLDGVELALSHFPRLDADYVASLKKLCVDRCLTVASLHHDAEVDAASIDDHVMALERSCDVALAIGAPLVRFTLAKAKGPPALSWRELTRGLKAACAGAKQRNVTLALEPRDASLVGSPLEVKRALKECDSAWLCVALDAAAVLGPHLEEWVTPLESSVIAIVPMSSLDTFGADERVDYISALAFLWHHRFRGFLTLEYRGLEDERPAVARAVAWLRGMLAKDELRTAAIETAP